jgi:hypothetical protein
MQCHRLSPLKRLRSNERRHDSSGFVHKGVLGAVVALAFCSSMVVVQHDAPEVDANTARESLVVLDELLAAPSSEER